MHEHTTTCCVLVGVDTVTLPTMASLPTLGLAAFTGFVLGLLTIDLAFDSVSLSDAVDLSAPSMYYKVCLCCCV